MTALTDTPPPAPPPGLRRLYLWERVGLGLLLLAVLAFGGLVLVRSAFQQSRKTDFDVYARAGYAVRAGLDLYQISDDNGWHYCYPPPFAVAMTPLADPLPWADRTGYLPFWASVAVWYLLSAALAWRTVHVLAAAVLPDTPRGTRRWWYARLVPLYVCVGGVGFTLGRGQVNVPAALVRGRAVRGRRAGPGLHRRAVAGRRRVAESHPRVPQPVPPGPRRVEGGRRPVRRVAGAAGGGAGGGVGAGRGRSSRTAPC